MEQAAAAARALARTDDVALALALETAMVVCFVRPYAGSLSVPRAFRPPTNDGSQDARVFRELMRLRDKVYAHDGGDEIVDLNWEEGWQGFPRGLLPEVVALAERLRDEMRVSAEKTQTVLNGDIAVEH
jgi:hypothetical protein